MRPSKLLFAAFACLTVAACGPHEGKVLRGAGHALRAERHAGQNGHGGGLRRSCRADIEQFCAADQKGRERRQCLASHRDKLSEDCKKALDERGGRKGKKDRGAADTDDSE